MTSKQIVLPDAHGIDRAVVALHQGLLIGLPTETVYGLGADASNADAVRRIFAAKQRPVDHPVIVHLYAAEHIMAWALDIPVWAQRLAESLWPGPLTLILPRAAHVLDEVTGGQSSVGLRVPSHPVARDVLKKYTHGIAAPSANRFGRISPTSARDVVDELGSAVDVVLDGGDCTVGIESTIIDAASHPYPILLRPGFYSAEHISDHCHERVRTSAQPTLRASGLLERHYAPQTRCYLVDTPVLLRAVEQGDFSEWLSAQAYMTLSSNIAVMAYQGLPSRQGVVVTSMPDQAALYAQRLYQALRDIDRQQADVLLIEKPPMTLAWHAVHDRLRRAVAG